MARFWVPGQKSDFWEMSAWTSRGLRGALLDPLVGPLGPKGPKNVPGDPLGPLGPYGVPTGPSGLGTEPSGLPHGALTIRWCIMPVTLVYHANDAKDAHVVSKSTH